MCDAYGEAEGWKGLNNHTEYHALSRSIPVSHTSLASKSAELVEPGHPKSQIRNRVLRVPVDVISSSGSSQSAYEFACTE